MCARARFRQESDRLQDFAHESRGSRRGDRRSPETQESNLDYRVAIRH